ncbi:RNA polymerase subunit AC19 [Rhizina undulata]
MSADHDIPMNDVVDDEPLISTEDSEHELRITTLPGAEEGSASFEIKEEDHTLGNALRYMIMKKYLSHLNFKSPSRIKAKTLPSASPEVEFCGYSIPHPSEAKMNIRIQIYPEYWEKTKPFDALIKGLDDLADLCDHVTEAFTTAQVAFGKE